jgi:hypothetical protein
LCWSSSVGDVLPADVHEQIGRRLQRNPEPDHHPPALGPSAVYSFSAVFSRQVDRLFGRLGNVTPLPGEEFAAPWELIVRESG